MGRLGGAEEDQQVVEADSVRTAEVVGDAVPVKAGVEEVVEEQTEGTAGEREKALLRRKFGKFRFQSHTTTISTLTLKQCCSQRERRSFSWKSWRYL